MCVWMSVNNWTISGICPLLFLVSPALTHSLCSFLSSPLLLHHLSLYKWLSNVRHWWFTEEYGLKHSFFSPCIPPLHSLTFSLPCLLICLLLLSCLRLLFLNAPMKFCWRRCKTQLRQNPIQRESEWNESPSKSVRLHWTSAKESTYPVLTALNLLY